MSRKPERRPQRGWPWPRSAAYGENGRIAFDEYTGSNYDINSIDPSGANPIFLHLELFDETEW